VSELELRPVLVLVQQLLLLLSQACPGVLNNKGTLNYGRKIGLFYIMITIVLNFSFNQ